MMTGRLRKTALTLHVMSSVGWLGSVAAFIAIAILAATSADQEMARAALLLMEPLGWLVIVPFAIASLITGIIQSLGTPWGLFRHYWVIFKLVINLLCVGILIEYMRTLAAISSTVADPSFSIEGMGQLRFSPLLHSTLAFTALVIAIGLAVFKPKGVTRYRPSAKNKSPTAPWAQRQ